MKKVYFWIDAQMKQAALLSKEEQDLSVWSYLSRLEPLPPAEKEDLAQGGSAFLAGIDEGMDVSGLEDEDFGLNQANYLDDDDIGLDMADYLFDGESELSEAGYIEEENFEIDQGDYLAAEGPAEAASSKQDEEPSDPLDAAKDESRGKQAPLFVRKYIAASAQPKLAEEEKLADLSGELKMRAFVHILGQKPLQIQFLSAHLDSYWENAFPPHFSLIDWLNGFAGQINVTYHTAFTIHHDSGPVTEDSYLAFTKLRSGTVNIGVPLKALFYYTWRFNFDTEVHTPVIYKRMIYLISDILERQDFNQLMEPERKQVILIGTDRESLARQKDRISTLPSVSHIHFFSSLSFYDVYMSMNDNQGLKTESVAKIAKRKIDLPVFLRMRINNWAEEGRAEEKLHRIINEAIHEMCNEWWLEHAPDDIVLMKKIVKVSVCFQTNITPALKRTYKENKRILTRFKNQDYNTKQAFFLQIENCLSPICNLLNEGTGVSR